MGERRNNVSSADIQCELDTVQLAEVNSCLQKYLPELISTNDPSMRIVAHLSATALRTYCTVLVVAVPP